MRHAQFCGVAAHSLAEEGKDYFMDFVKCLFPRIEVCIKIAKALLAKGEPEMEACIKEYKAAKLERDLYRPYYYMANRILELAAWTDAYQSTELEDLPPVPRLMLLLETSSSDIPALTMKKTMGAWQQDLDSRLKGFQ